MNAMIQKMLDQVNKFSFAQMTSNASGKTSASGTMGVYIITFSVIAFIFGCIDKACMSHTTDIMMYSSANIVIGAGLLGYRKSKEGTGTDLLQGDSAPEVPIKEEPKQ